MTGLLRPNSFSILCFEGYYPIPPAMEVVDMLKKSLALVVLSGAMFSTQFAQAQFQDHSFRYWYGSEFQEPGNGKEISKNILSFAHVDGGNKLGNNFLNVDLLKSNHTDPANNAPATGATEVYIVYR